MAAVKGDAALFDEKALEIRSRHFKGPAVEKGNVGPLGADKGYPGKAVGEEFLDKIEVLLKIDQQFVQPGVAGGVGRLEGQRPEDVSAVDMQKIKNGLVVVPQPFRRDDRRSGGEPGDVEGLARSDGGDGVIPGFL